MNVKFSTHNIIQLLSSLLTKFSFMSFICMLGILIGSLISLINLPVWLVSGAMVLVAVIASCSLLFSEIWLNKTSCDN